ncbi:fatty acyl-CoA reductase wat-like [Schistocerca cancellata]|uniref:fatty acyl-CoA reductase wat-like n=1 Tax=Schistocerca cancellata TaxID=274614 RepID=UPI0021190F57|nr:fatty acyl-CoA reductase wat-like [Schistocerca cancellata]
MPCCDIHPRRMSAEEQERELDGDPLDLLPHEQLARLSQVASFYDGACVLITGATGFLGTSLLEKLLRTCTGISRIYVLIRDKKGVPLRERVRRHLQGVFFSKTGKTCPDYISKVVPIAGDCSQPGLGISAADAEELAGKVSVVFHVAATVRFDEILRIAANTNVAATRDVINLAKRMPNLKAFIHVSSAYSNCTFAKVEEKFYPPSMTTEELLKLLSVMDDNQLAQILPKIMGDWPNTYAFTKAIAEDTVRVHAAGLPAAVIRPSIVVSTAEEPLALWVSNMYGPIGVAAGAGVGLMRVFLADPDVKADLVPVDLVTNATIACAWDTWQKHSQLPKQEQVVAVPSVYNLVSGMRHPVTWRDFMRHTEYGTNFPPKAALWYYSLILCRKKWTHDLCAIFLHLVPAIFVDTFLRLRGKKPILWETYNKVHKFTGVLERFSTNEWEFEEDNVITLLQRLGTVDRKLFPFDVKDLDWECLLSISTRGLRVYLANDSFDTLDAARVKYRRLKIMHYTLISTGVALILLLLWWLLFV